MKTKKKTATPASKKSRGTGTRSYAKTARTAVAVKSAPVPTARKARKKFRNGGPVSSDFFVKLAMKVGGGVAGYIGTNIAGKAVAGFFPAAHQNIARIGTKVAITGLAAWQGHKFIPRDVAEGVVIGAGIATVEDVIKTYAKDLAPTLLNDIVVRGAFNDEAALNGTVGEQYRLKDQEETINLNGVLV